MSVSRGETLFIYYRVGADQIARVIAQVGAWQRALRSRHAGLATRLYIGADAPDSAVRTVMETYEPPVGGLPDDLRLTLVEGAPELAAIRSERHVERFVACVW